MEADSVVLDVNQATLRHGSSARKSIPVRAKRSVYFVRKLRTRCAVPNITSVATRIGRLMRIAGIAEAARGKHTTTTTSWGGQSAPRHLDLIDRAWDWLTTE